MLVIPGIYGPWSELPSRETSHKHQYESDSNSDPRVLQCSLLIGVFGVCVVMGISGEDFLDIFGVQLLHYYIYNALLLSKQLVCNRVLFVFMV